MVFSKMELRLTDPKHPHTEIVITFNEKIHINYFNLNGANVLKDEALPENAPDFFCIEMDGTFPDRAQARDAKFAAFSKTLVKPIKKIKGKKR